MAACAAPLERAAAAQNAALSNAFLVRLCTIFDLIVSQLSEYSKEGVLSRIGGRRRHPSQVHRPVVTKVSLAKQAEARTPRNAGSPALHLRERVDSALGGPARNQRMQRIESVGQRGRPRLQDQRRLHLVQLAVA